MAKRKKQMGRPTKNLLPARVNVPIEDPVRAMFAMPADHEWKYLRTGGTQTACRGCGRAVHYPDALDSQGLCAEGCGR